MLDKKEHDLVIDFVHKQPRTIQEIAQLLNRNWRTAEKYVDIIAKETGLIGSKTFREGTRGALRIVYANPIGRIRGSAHQERLQQQITQSRRKQEFSPFDIYQFIDSAKRAAYFEREEFSTHEHIRWDTVLSQAREKVLFFSGNLSWMELGPRMPEVISALAKKGVSMNVLTRIDMTSQENTSEMLALNERFGHDFIHIRHCEQPLRAVIIDNHLACIKEVLSPNLCREIKKECYLFYKISDEEWIAWLQKVFWQLWQHSIDAHDRLQALHSIQGVPNQIAPRTQV